MQSLPEALEALFAFTTCACILPFLARFAARRRLYDQPGDLKIHRTPVARIGGVAIMAGVAVCVGPLVIHDWQRYGLFLLAIAGVWTVGLVDDLKTLPVAPRFGVQCLAAVMLWV